MILVSCVHTSNVVQDTSSATQKTIQSPSPEPTEAPNPQAVYTPTQALISKGCESQNNLQQLNTTGKIVFYEPDKGLIFYNPQTNQDGLPLETEKYVVESSPDKKRIFIFDYPGTSGDVITSDGNKSIINANEINGIFYGWLNNQKIVFVDLNHSDGSITILDIETGKTEEKITNLTNINFDTIHWYAGGSQPSVIFDSSLSRLIYTSRELPSINQPHLGFILQDYETKKVLWSKQSTDIAVEPKWSPDGNFVAVAITEENSDRIYFLDGDGNEIQTINTNAFIYQMEWSPNGKQIAFNSDNAIIVYNLVTKNRNDYKLSESIYNIVWSPNSDQLAIKGALIDFSTNCIFSLKPENQNGPLAWLIDK